ncbi:hypothetical protein F5888DRAFT_1716905 [Russula emetica]|nr:hypothetical protein F5888DRAFT_1716905 [Russula emetica]
MKRMERDATALSSSELLRPTPAVGDESSVGYDAGTGLFLVKEKNRIIDPERGHAASFLLFPVASEIEVPHAGPGCQVKVGIADHEDDLLEPPSCASDHVSHTKTNNNGAATTIVPSQVVQVRIRAPSNTNMNTLRQQVRHPHRRLHHSRHKHQIGARSILPRIQRRARSWYQRRRSVPSVN